MKSQILKCTSCNLNYFPENVELSPEKTQWLCPNCGEPNKMPVEVKKDEAIKMVPLHVVPLKIQPKQDAVEMLENTIKRIKAGEITAVGIGYTTSEGSVGGDVSEGRDNFLMWASLEHLARTFYTQTILGED